MKRVAVEKSPPSSRSPQQIGFSFQEDLWFGDFDDDAARQAAAGSMAAMAGRIMGARPFPAAAQRLVQLTRNEDTNIQKVVRVLESDPGLSQRVLRLVNSAGYGLRVRCTSLNHATALLGQQRLQQIATSAVLLNHFGRTSDETKRKQEHGALVASLCRYLAIHLGLPQEDLFTCGLLHDLGQLMMLDEGNNEYRELVRAHEEQWDALHISEREIMGFDHAVLAAHVLASWSIPAPVPEVIALHHQPALAHQRGSKIAAMVQTLRFADHMSHLLEHYTESQGSKLLADSEAASYLGFSEMQIAAMWKDLRQLHEANRSRRMDIQDVAPRSLSVPASLSPRAVPFTDPPENYGPPSAGPTSIGNSMAPALHSISEQAWGGQQGEETAPSISPPQHTATAPAPSYSDPPPATLNSLRPAQEQPVPSVRVSTAPLSLRSEQEVIRLSEATPVAHAQTFGEREVSPMQAEQRRRPSTRFEEDEDDERPSVMGAEPEVFPCAMCYGPTFGAQCPVCAAHVCGAHQTTEREWCMACDDEFHRFTREHEVPGFVRIASGTAMGVSVFSSAFLGGWELGFGVLGICLTSGLAAYAVHQGYLKSRFKRDRAPVDDAPPTLFTPSFDRGRWADAPVHAHAPLSQLDFDDEESAYEPQEPVASPSAAPEQITKPKIAEYSSSPMIFEQASNVIQFGEAAASSGNDQSAPNPHAAVTIPAPSVTRAREREESLRASQPQAPGNFSWPPSQNAPATSQRTSFLPQAPPEDVPLVSLSEPPGNMNEAEEENFEMSHQAIAPPSMALESDEEDEYFSVPEAPRPYHSTAPKTSEPVENNHSADQDAPTNDFAMEPVSSRISESTNDEGPAPAEVETAQEDAKAEAEPESAQAEGTVQAEPETAQTDAEAEPTESEASEDHVLAATSQRSATVPPQLRSEPPMCQPIALGGVVITPPVIHRQMEFCTAPSGTVRIATLELHEPGKGPTPSNDQISQQASGEL